MSDAPAPVADQSNAVVAPADLEPTHEVLVEELLVEEVSIDGMCGVY